MMIIGRWTHGVSLYAPGTLVVALGGLQLPQVTSYVYAGTVAEGTILNLRLALHSASHALEVRSISPRILRSRR